MKVGSSERFMRGRKSTLPENIIVCIAAALAGTFYFYERYYGETIHTAVCLLLTAALVLTWTVCALYSGRDGKLGFAVFAFLYWSVPYFYLMWYGTRDNLHDYNKWLAMSSKAAKALLYDPFREAAERTGSDPAVYAAGLLIAVMAMYIVGALAGRLRRADKEKTENEQDNQ